MSGARAASVPGGEHDGKGFEMLPWDTAFFGFPTARMAPVRVDKLGLIALLKSMANANVELAYCFADPADAETNQAAQDCGGFLADVKTTYSAVPPVYDSGRIRCEVVPVALGEENPDLYALAVEAGRFSRFHFDPGFPPGVFRALYAEWLRKSLSGERADWVLAARENGRFTGLITVLAKSGIGNIGLLAVDPDSKGRGIGTSLMQTSLQWFIARGCSIVEVVTQGRNLVATHLFESSGFAVTGRMNIYHFRPLG